MAIPPPPPTTGPLYKRLGIQEKAVKYTWKNHGVYESSVKIVAIRETY
jgi:hypothetical protein